MTYKILITDKINTISQNILSDIAQVDYQETMTHDDLIQTIGSYDALMVRSESKITKDVLDRAKNLKVIGRAGVGTDNIDVKEATKNGIIVLNSPAGNTIAAAEHTIAMMLSLSRHIPEADVSVKEGKWERSKFVGNQLYKKNLGIIGLGKIGSYVAKVAKALGMTVLVYDPYLSDKTAKELGIIKSEPEDIWTKSDYITIHAPKTKETYHMLDHSAISKMKEGVRIINCARGGIIDEEAMAEAINNGKIAGAAVDVFEEEPAVHSPLLKLSQNIILTPHLGASTEEAQINVALDVAEQIKSVLTGGSAHGAVNIPSFTSEKLEPVKHYLNLAINLGEMARQITNGAIKTITITACGELAKHDIDPLVVGILKGVFSISLEGVNFVNAHYIAEKQGIDIVKSLSENSFNYKSLLKVELTTDTDKKEVAGNINIEKQPRIIQIAEYKTNLPPDEHILLIPHINQPGMIAKVATILGNANINISMMQVEKKLAYDDNISIMLINLDNPVHQSILQAIKEADGIQSAKYVNLSI